VDRFCVVCNDPLDEEDKTTCSLACLGELEKEEGRKLARLLAGPLDYIPFSLEPPDGYYTYIIADLSDGSVFYVGKGCGKRAWDSKKERVSVKYASSINVDVYLIECETENEAYALETFFICRFGGSTCLENTKIPSLNSMERRFKRAGYRFDDEAKQLLLEACYG